MKKNVIAVIAALSIALLATSACASGTVTPDNDNQGNQNVTDGENNDGNHNVTDGGNSDGNHNAVINNGYSIIYAFTADSDVMEITSQSSMYDYMCALKEDGNLVFEGSESQYGFYITSVMGIGSKTVSSTDHFYSGWDWAVYSTLESVDGVIYGEETILDFNGVQLHKGLYGVSGIPCIEGESYALVYEYSEMSF